MTTIQVPAELLVNVTNYIKLASAEANKANEQIKDLTQKLTMAKKTNGTPSAIKLSAEKATEAAQALIDAGLLSVEKKAAMVSTLQDPNALCKALVQVTDLYRQRPLGVVEKTASDKTTTVEDRKAEAKRKFASSIGVR